MTTRTDLPTKFVLLFLLSGTAPGFAAVLGQEPPASQSPQPGPADSNPAAIDSFPSVVARVNDSEIRKAELLGRAKAVRGQMGIPTEDPMPLDFYRNVLNELIGIELLFQKSKAEQLAATTAEVEEQLEQFRSQFPDEAAFNTQLSDQGITTEELRLLILKDLSVQRLIEGKFLTRVAVTEEQKRQFYENNKSQMQEPEKLRLSHILIRVEDDASDEVRMAARAKLVGIREEAISGGKTFSDLAREHSEDQQTKDSGGEMTIQKGQTVPSFETAAFALETESISEVVETRFGYHLIKLTERIPAREAPFEEVEPMISQYLQQEGLQKQIESEVQALQSGASIELFI